MGDCNTRHFDGATKARKKRNSIEKICDGNGIMHRHDEAIAEIAQLYFQELFTTSSPTPLNNIFKHLQTKMTEEMNAMLMR